MDQQPQPYGNQSARHLPNIDAHLQRYYYGMPIAKVPAQRSHSFFNALVSVRNTASNDEFLNLKSRDNIDEYD